MVEQHVITHVKDALVSGLPLSPNGNSAEYVKSATMVRFGLLSLPTGSLRRRAFYDFV